MERVKVTKDEVSKIIGAITELVGKQVLVGIPDTSTEREDQTGSPITNAALGYIHENGAPEANIPARPWLIPGAKKAEPQYLPHLEDAAKSSLDGDASAADKSLQAAGTIAASSAKNEINTGNFVPLKPSTVRNRRYSRQTQSMRSSEKKYLGLIAQGMSPADAQTAAGIKPLVNTAQMRNSVTSVVRRK